MDVALKLLGVLALVLANAFFVAAEFSLVSVRRTRIDQLAAQGNTNARTVQYALRNINRYIAATQVGITVASLVLGGLGEHTLEPLFAAPLRHLMPPRFEGITRIGVATTLAYFVMTTFHVVIGELLPKSITLQRAEKMALFVVRPMTLFVRVSTPLVWFLNAIGTFLLSRLGIPPAQSHTTVHSPEELDLLFTQAHEGGKLSATERDLLHRVVRFSDLTAGDLMVPRVELVALPEFITREQLDALLRDMRHTRYPVQGATLDEIPGIVHLKDLVRLRDSLGHTPQDRISLRPLLREPPRVPESVALDKLLLHFKRQRQQMAVVIDEYGGTAGIITLGDLLEQVFGDVDEDPDAAPGDALPRQEGNCWHFSGRALISEVNELSCAGLPDEPASTIAGLILAELGRPAVVGDTVQVGLATVRVEAVQHLRIMTVSVECPDPAHTQEPL